MLFFRVLFFRAIGTSLVAAFLLTSARGVAEANCGLDYCPLPEDAKADLSLGTVQLLVRHVEFSSSEGDGSYWEHLLRLEVQRFSNWNFGAWIAPIVLTVDDETRTGVSNPVFFVERREPIADRWKLLGGLQLEMPMGDSHSGIASSHSELLSYVGVAFNGAGVALQAQGGFATSLSEGHGHVGGNPVFVNPHADQEVQGRASLIVPLLDGKLQPGAQLHGRMVVMEEVEDRTFLTGALSVTYQVTTMARLQGRVELPLTDAQRFDWRAGLGIGLAF